MAQMFPFFENIENKRFLVIGGGTVAKNKIEKLKLFTDNITVLCKETDIEDVCVVKKAFEENDVSLFDYVIGATDSKQTNSLISTACKKRGIAVNIVDCPEECTFFFPSVIRRGSLTVAVSSGGKSPAFCKEMRKRIENILPENTEEILDEMEELRARLKKSVSSEEERGKILKAVLSLYLSGQSASEEEIQKIISEHTK